MSRQGLHPMRQYNYTANERVVKNRARLLPYAEAHTCQSLPLSRPAHAAYFY
jgi:hypothetical protein